MYHRAYAMSMRVEDLEMLERLSEDRLQLSTLYCFDLARNDLGTTDDPLWWIDIHTDCAAHRMECPHTCIEAIEEYDNVRVDMHWFNNPDIPTRSERVRVAA